jgi:tetratricopeptide (TPR) repeat protein
MKRLLNTVRSMRNYILAAILCLQALTIHAKQYNKADSAKAWGLVIASHKSSLSNPKLSFEQAEQAFMLADSIGYRSGVAAGLVSMGFACYHQGDIKNAFKYNLEGLGYMRKNRLYRMEGGALNRLGVLYLGIGSLDKAFECFEAELKVHQEYHDSIYIADCYSNMGIILAKQNLPDKAIKNYHKAIEMYHSLKSPEYEAYMDRAIADIYIQKKQYPEALTYILASIKLHTDAQSYASFGDYYHAVDNEDSALYHYTISLKMFTADSDRLDMAKIMGDIGDIETGKGNYKAAEEHLKQALAIAQALSDLEETGNRESGLAALYKQQKDFSKALEHYMAATKAKDSFNKAETNGKLAELSTRFEVKEVEDKNKVLQKENDLQRLRLQRKNYLIFGAITSLMVFLLIGLLLFRQNKLRANQQKTELEQKQLRAQMNPHFIFNCLNSIQHFVVINDVLNANKYLSGFASLMRQTLENSKEGTITLSKEIAYLENYLALELMRFKDKFTADLVCAENIDINAVKIPAMIIQPFIENAIRHGLNFLDKKQGKLVIKFYLKDGDLFCEIDDNGIGRMQSQKLKEHTNIIYESQGMELTRQRLALVSKSSGSDYSIAIIDKRSVQNEPEGTTVIIKFPVEA